MNKKGFIATSLIYSFFLIFITLFLTIIADYLQDKVLLNNIESGIKQDLNNGVGLADIKVGDKIVFQGNSFPSGMLPSSIQTDGTKVYTVESIDVTNKTIKLSGERESVNMGDNIFTKEPSDREFITITGVKTS